ncbi:zinc finger protein [Ceratocystis lukuohia]|uniref:Zinc finger protein ZPR1 n=3 Tax=Ceratocystis TaxID=5157 RepID=A0A0F8B4M8_CERFI|nr:Zinc finger protein ZPR1 [Ceratocystis platani]PHH49689.1 Zinc finger protein zpr1 [Ceratocystis fimbriata CBS 114723]
MAVPTEFQSIGAHAEQTATSDDVQPVEQIESLCMNCHKNGWTRMLLTSIPYFREIIIMSFSCEHCGFQNNEIQPAGSIQPKGTHYELRLTSLADFERQVIKADTATIKFIELDLEVPSGRGQLTNVEGVLTGIIDDLAMGQETRKAEQPEVYAKIEEIIARGKKMLAGEAFPFRMYVDDPAGNSFISPDLKDGVGKWEKHEFLRTPEQNKALGLTASGEQADGTLIGDPVKQPSLTEDGEIAPNEVYSFPATCPGCTHACVTHMKMVDIPHFKQVVLMSTVCDSCGYRSNDVKTGGEIPDKGERITLKVEDEVDLARDILKSESCALECPELNLVVNAGTLGGRFTTVEGLLTQVRNDLHNQIFEAQGSKPTQLSSSAAPVEKLADEKKEGSEERMREAGDSMAEEQRSTWTKFFEGLDTAIRGEKPFTLVLSDPLASSYVQTLVDPPATDPKITREVYDRTEDEEEDLGLNDMKVEGYENDAAASGDKVADENTMDESA